MDVRELLEQVKSGSVEIEDAQMRLKNLPYEDLGYAKLDHHRKLRSGFGETVFCQGKPDAYLLEIYKKFYERDGEVLGTRASESQAELVRTAVPEVVYDPISRILKVEKPGKERRGCVAVCTGGTADIPVAEEAAQTAEYFGCSADRIFDVGVAGIHRLLAQRERLWWQSPPLWDTAPASMGYRLFLQCLIPVPTGYRWLILTMDTGPATWRPK